MGERFGRVRRLFRRRGHAAFSCDLQPAVDSQRHHLLGDVRRYLDSRYWDLLIAHPDCTYLAVSGLHWNKRRPQRRKLTDAAVRFVAELMCADIAKIAIENPVGCLSTRIRKPDQIVQPYMFGDDASKKTCFWLKNLPLLDVPHEEDWIAPRIVDGRPTLGQPDRQRPKQTWTESDARARSRTHLRWHCASDGRRVGID